MSSFNLFLRLSRYSIKYWKGLILVVLATAIIAGTETAFPALMKPLMDKGFNASIKFHIWWIPAGVLTIFAVRGLASFTANYSLSWVSNNVLVDLRRNMFSKLLTLPVPTFDSESPGKMIVRMIAEAHLVLNVATTVTMTLIRDSLILLGLILWLFWINWKLTMVVVLLAPCLAWLTTRFSARMRAVSHGQMSASSEMTTVVSESISGNRVIKIFQGQDYEKSRFNNANMSFRGQAMRLAIAQSLQSPVIQFMTAVGVALILTIWMFQARTGATTIGDFVSYLTALLMMFGPLRHLADVNGQLQRGLAAAESVFGFVDELSEQDAGTRELRSAKGDIEFVDVWMEYPSREIPALKGVSFKFQSGKTYALVGPSGSGKTTVVNLLPRFYEPKAGTIRVDTFNIKDISLASLRASIAVVPQETLLFDDSIANNIAYGNSPFSEEKLWFAIENADLKNFVTSLPAGMNTKLGDRGLLLSGGQRQKIALARAFYKDAPILILDEATSALDSQSEFAIQSAINKLRKGRTTIIVAHRLSTISGADCILVMSEGRVVQSGTHLELIEEEGIYKNLYSNLYSSEELKEND